MRKSYFILFFSFLLFQVGVYGQGTDNRITGVVFDQAENVPLPTATVVAHNVSTGFRTGIISDISGRFVLQNLPIGGPYTITITFVGYSKYEVSGIMLTQGDDINMGTISLTTDSEHLEEVVVTFDAFTADRKRLGTATKINNITMQRIPSANRNYQDLAALSPLTVGINPAGQNRGQTGFVLDGVPNRRNTFGDIAGGAFGVSMDAIEEFEVSNNDYDVSSGRGGAMVIKASTKSGTNELKGSVFGYNSSDIFTGNTYLRDPSGAESFGTQDEFTTRQVGFSLGGPIIKDKLHFFANGDFHVWDRPWGYMDFEKAGATLEEAERALGITKANMDEIVSILRGPTYNMPDALEGKQYGTIQVKRKTGSAMLKLDWTINDKNRAVLKYNYHMFHRPDKNNGLLSTRYEEDSYDHSVTLQLRTDVSPTSFNDFRINFIHHRRANGWDFPRAPVGQVRVNSTFYDGSSKNTEIFWGNQFWCPEIISETDYSIVNNYRFVAGNIRYTVGGEILVNTIKDLLTHYQQGHFLYDGIENLRNNIPYRYERKTPMSDDAGDYVRPYTIYPALYAQMQTTLWEHVDLTAGLRWDAQLIPRKPKYNESLHNILGVNNAGTPNDYTGIQPRMNVIWDVGGKGTDIVKFGAGRFISQPTTQSLTMAQIDNGVDYFWVVADTRLAGFTQADLPPADWPAFFESFDNVPGPEYIYDLLDRGVITTPPSFVIAIDDKLKMPKTWKLNANYHHYFSTKFNVGIGGYYTRTMGNFYYTNKNLNQPQFYLASEGNRAVYVPESTLIGKREAVADNARISDNFTQVMQFTNADWPNNYVALVAEANMRIGKDGSVAASYTRGESKGGVHYTSGNSREFHYVGSSYHDWGKDYRNYPDRDQLRHKLVFTGIMPTIWGFSAGVTFIGAQGIGFTMAAPRDIIGIGRGAPTDNVTLCYIFDPDNPATPQYLRDGINHVLENSDPRYATYIKDHIGTFAAPYAGRQPWRYDLNVSVSKSIKIIGSHSLQIRTDIFNLPNLFNKTWGGYHEIYNTNLYSNVTGWDAANSRWIYAVNQNAGQKRYRVTSPFQVHLGARYTF